MSKTGLCLVTVLLAVFSVSSVAQEVSTRNGLSTVTYETPEGRIKLNYPQTLLAGDRFTGTVVAEPKGESEEEKAVFSDRISGYVVEVNDSVETSTRDEKFRWVLPGALSALSLVLRDPGGKVVSRMDAPIVTGPGDVAMPGADITHFELPSIAQVGHPVEVSGPFDGDAGSTTVSIGETPVGVLAESPRAAYFEAPPDRIGVNPIAVTENGETTEGEFRVIGFAYELPKTNLTRGEQTTLTTTVHGLEGLDRPVILELVNHTPDIVGMPEGDMEFISIDPGMVSDGGTFSFARDITGRQQGDFELSLTLVSSEEKDPCEELGDAIDSVVERAREKELESDELEDEAIELEDFADKIEAHPPSRFREIADTLSKPARDESEADRIRREETLAGLQRFLDKLEELNCGETMRERKRAAKRLRQEAEDLNKKRDRLRAEAEKLREQADELREQHRKCLEGQPVN